jgi:hypothetical protein
MRSRGDLAPAPLVPRDISMRSTGFADVSMVGMRIDGPATKGFSRNA